MARPFIRIWRTTSQPAILIALVGFACVWAIAAAALGGAQAVSSEPTAQSSLAANSQRLLDQAEPLYKTGNYKDALPLYIKASQEASTTEMAPKDRIHYLRYLADCYCRLNLPDQALAQYEAVGTLISADDIANLVDNQNEQAACYGLKGDYAKAESMCRTALKIGTESKPEPHWQVARTYAHLGYLEYMQARYASAIPFFQQAEQELDKSGRSDVVAEAFRQKMHFARAGSFYHLRQFAEAYEQFKRMYDCDVRLFGKTDLQTGWVMLGMSDVLEKINKPHEAEDWYRKAIYVFRKFNRDRLLKEFASQSTSTADFEKQVNSYVFGKSSMPSDLQDTQEPLCKDSSTLVNTHDPRTLYARLFIDAPGRVWLNPFVKQRGLVIAIHGLSLEHSSYDAFAKELADYGFCTVAFDIRGFGSYQQALGAEHLDFAGCMRDLHLVVSAIKADNPQMPLFILGESMGGAIALQFAAQYPELVDGLVASVPAGKRFKQRRTAVKVAVRYIENKHRPFDIGTDVINQATHDPTLKKMWSENPKTRSTLSPQELMAFQSMCDHNLEYAKQIQHTPVIIYQGVSDELVKPEATYDLFRAVECKDKSFVMVGNAEHLIFEEGCFTPAVLKGLVAWMESHSAVPDSKAYPAGTQR